MTDTKADLFVMVHVDLLDLVADGQLSKNAAWLYVALLRHHNRKRADDDVWPSRTSLARAIGLKKPESVDGYMDELKAQGLVVVTERRIKGLKASNRYTLNLIVAEADAPKAGPRYPEKGVTIPRDGGSATPKPGDELDQGELHQGKLNQASLSADARTSAAAPPQKIPQPREREAGFSDQKFPTAEHRLLAKYGWEGKDANSIIRQLNERYDIYGIGWWITADKNGTLPDRIQELVDEALADNPDWKGPRPVNGRWPAAL